MANHKSAKKRTRQSLKRRERNRHDRSELRTAVKQVRTAVSAGDAEAATAALRRAEKLLGKASGGILHWKTASRQISRLTRATNSLSA